MVMLKIAVIGAGDHSVRYHLPALREYVKRNPGNVELTGLCDLRHEHGKAMCRRFGFKNYYDNIDNMMTLEKPDGIVAITPMHITKDVVKQLLHCRAYVLMEKPLGTTLDEAREICMTVEQSKSRVMVSVNRRFNPMIGTSINYLGDRPLEFIRATMLRHKRIEPKFFFETAMHSVDVLRHYAGDVKSYSVMARKVRMVNWYTVHFVFQRGVTGILEVIPNCGCRAESYELFGADYRILAEVTEDEMQKVTLWECGQITQSQELLTDPQFVCNGTYQETEEFISSILQNRHPKPTPHDVLQSVELCSQIQQEVEL